MTLLLGIDTASHRFALALEADGEVVRSMEQDARFEHSQLLLPAVAKILGAERPSLGGVVVAQGPGSYAGLRVGMATAGGLATALAVPVVGVGTLEAVAAASGLSTVTAIHPAGRGQTAFQRFEAGVATTPIKLARLPLAAAKQLAGEGAGGLGGTEVTPLQRCIAALRLARERGPLQKAGPLEPVYLREPYISQPRRSRMSRAARA